MQPAALGPTIYGFECIYELKKKKKTVIMNTNVQIATDMY